MPAADLGLKCVFAADSQQKLATVSFRELHGEGVDFSLREFQTSEVVGPSLVIFSLDDRDLSTIFDDCKVIFVRIFMVDAQLSQLCRPFVSYLKLSLQLLNFFLKFIDSNLLILKLAIIF